MVAHVVHKAPDVDAAAPLLPDPPSIPSTNMSIKMSLKKNELTQTMIQDCADDLRGMADQTWAKNFAPEIRQMAGLLDRIAVAVATGDYDLANALAVKVDMFGEALRNRKMLN
jgi:hypothetical protein